MAESGFEELPVRLAHAEAAQDLPWRHRDLFDRLLVAQAVVEGLTLVTRDRIFEAYDVRGAAGVRRGGPQGAVTVTNSTSKITTAPGGITTWPVCGWLAPWAPYASAGGMMMRRVPPWAMASMPISKPGTNR